MNISNEQPAVSLVVDFPDRPLNRVSTAFRLVLVVPIVLLAALLQSGKFGSDLEMSAWFVASGITGAGVIVLPTALMLVIRGKYPRWWFDWNLELLRFVNRIAVYTALMDDRYPATDDEQGVHLQLRYPDVNALDRALPLFKWLLAIPHYLILGLLFIPVALAIMVAWFAILFTGKYPTQLFRLVEGFLRWGLRVNAYAFVLVTDDYPPFRLSA